MESKNEHSMKNKTSTTQGPGLAFELRARDGLARIAQLSTPHGTIETPTLLPVINPHDQIISASEMKKLFGTSAVITNSYIIYKSEDLHDKTVKNGVHKLLDFDGPVMTDSGTFQLFTYGKVSVKPNDIIKFQQDIKPDIGTILDVFGSTDQSFDEAKKNVELTLSRAAEAVQVKGDFALAGTIQGGVYPDLREHCAKEMSKLPFSMHPIGGVVPFMEEYKFKELVKIIIASKKGLTHGRPVHLFGAGHPIIFPLAVALGCDTFDSASYIKYANDNRFIFTNGTKKLEQLDELPCFCPVCADTSISEIRSLDDELRRKMIAKHNLYVCFNDLTTIKQAIHEGTIWELVEQRASSHPHMIPVIRELYKEWKYLEKYEPISRKRLLFLSSESLNRPDARRFVHRIKNNYVRPKTTAIVCFSDTDDRTKSMANHFGSEIAQIQEITDTHIVFQTIYGPVPIEFDGVYPFSQTVIEPSLAVELTNSKKVISQMQDYSHKLTSEFSIVWDGEETLETLKMMVPEKKSLDFDEVRLRAIADFQFGFGSADSLFIGELELVKSKRTGKIRNISSNGEHILSLRAGDGLFTLKVAGAKRLHNSFESPRMRVIVNKDSAEFNVDGKNVFAKFVVSADPNLRPNDEVLVTDEDDALVAIGRLILTTSEQQEFQSGIAVRVREGIK